MVRQRTASHALYPKYWYHVPACQQFPATLYMRARGMRNSKQILHGSQTTLGNIFAGRPRQLPWPKNFDSNADARSVCGS